MLSTLQITPSGWIPSSNGVKALLKPHFIARCVAKLHPRDTRLYLADIRHPDRRFLLSLGVALPFSATADAITPPALASSARLKSLACSHPAVLTFTNSLPDHAIKIFWINYDYDPELYAILPPGASWTVDTFETHPWRVLDAETGEMLTEHVALRGEYALNITVPGVLASAAQTQGTKQVQSTAASDGSKNVSSSSMEHVDEKDIFEGFDGVGGKKEEYSEAEVVEIALDHLGGVVLLAVQDFQAPVPLPISALDAAQIFHATGADFRRPTTVLAWTRSLEATGAHVQRCLVTRIVGTTYYARIVLLLPDGTFRSVDSRPSDAMAIAMASGAPLFVAKGVARAQQPGGSVESRFSSEPPSGRMPPTEEMPRVPAAANGGAVRTSGIQHA